MDKKERVSALFFVFCAMIHSETDGEMPEPGGIRAVCGEVKGCLSEGMEPRIALEEAITDCIDQDILAGFLKKYRPEVLGMLLEEFGVKKYERSLREEGREEGLEQGGGGGRNRTRKRALQQIGLSVTG